MVPAEGNTVSGEEEKMRLGRLVCTREGYVVTAVSDVGFRPAGILLSEVGRLEHVDSPCKKYSPFSYSPRTNVSALYLARWPACLIVLTCKTPSIESRKRCVTSDIKRGR